MRRALALALLLAASPAGAGTIVIDFEAELAGERGPSFTATCGCVTFFELDRLAVQDFDGSQALVVGEEGGELLMTFLVPVFGVALDFGNDSPDEDVDAGIAILTGLVGGLAQTLDWTAPNRNGAVDQTLAIAFGEPLTQATFEFGQLGPDEPISPVVDRIVLTVPEPALALLLPLAAAAATACRRRRRSGCPSTSS